MELQEQINTKSSGADFVRADLHIHSYKDNGSYDVEDVNMTAEKIVDTAIQENIKIIAITDHNSIGNVKAAISYSKDKNVLVIPAVEITTSQGHLLLYFPNFNKLSTFFGKLDFDEDKKLCTQTIRQCLDVAENYNGFGILAHIDTNGGFEVGIKGYTTEKKEIIKHKTLLALEITNVENKNWYTQLDTVAERKHFRAERQVFLSEENTYEICKVLSSDAHTLERVGKNAKGEKRITRFKIDELSFESLKISFNDSEARVRIEDLIPENIPHIVGIKFNGGFLDGQIVKFSKNLTCIIGGRGTGKSTILESVRAGSGNDTRAGLIDNDVWPERISLIYEDETNTQQCFIKDKLTPVKNVTNQENGIVRVPIESFGQGETADTIRNCDKDPGALLKFLDEFIEVDDVCLEDERILDLLLTNQGEIEQLEMEVGRIPEYTRAKTTALQQLNILKKQKASEIVKLEEGLAKERGFMKLLISNLNSLTSGVKNILSCDALFKQILDSKDEEVIIGKNEFLEVKKIVVKYQGEIVLMASELDKNSKEVITKINAEIEKWKIKDTETQNKIEKIRSELQESGVKLDLGFIRKVTADVVRYSEILSLLAVKNTKLISLKKQRSNLLDERLKNKTRGFLIRDGFSKILNLELKSTIIDFNISLKFKEGLLSNELQELLKNSLGYRTAQVPKAELIAKQISVPKLITIIKNKNWQLLKEVKDSSGKEIFNQKDCEEIISTLGKRDFLFQLERCRFEDRPIIQISKEYEPTPGNKQYLIKDFSQLSLGQQQSILLSIFLYSKSNKPLLIDQPEDNLDSQFIYKTLVKNLRRVKENRQVILVTHNANIAVLGDAELIIPLKSTNELSMIVDRGSVDNSATKKTTCNILEGGEHAFKKRKQIYGI
jgi:ABC-type lipoprotein export system ATPase subunit/histidinol phosphatase-like PHP family hydrolase